MTVFPWNSGISERERVALQAVLVDFIARGDSPDTWKMVLIEEGPWPTILEDRLRAIQHRLYGCIDAALDGQLAQQFPRSQGGHIIIQLDCYDIASTDLTEFFDRFSADALRSEAYSRALDESRFVRAMDFELNLGTTK